MMAGLDTPIALWAPTLLGLGGLTAAGMALKTRSLIASWLSLASAGALVAASLAAFGAGEAALVQALAGVALAPSLALAALVLSSRAIRGKDAGPPVVSLVAAGVLALILAYAVFGGAGRIARGGVMEEGQASVLLLAPLLLVMAASCLALLGFGERGAFDHPPSAGRGS